MSDNTRTEMHICIENDLKKRFHANCVLRGRKMSDVVTELIEQWLQTNEASANSEDNK
jgi:ParG